jgi:hypothetical protein
MEGPASHLSRLVDSLQERPAQLAQFHEKMRVFLDRTWIQLKGKPVSLAAYLSACDSQGSPGGDEQAVVDQLTRGILEALGYGQADIQYNSSMAVAQGRAIPDYTISLAGSSIAAPLFFVEDKSTDVRNLGRKQHGRTGEESPLDQLRRYTRSGRGRSDAGLLCNGWSLEAWQFDREGDSRVVSLDLYGLAKHAVERKDAPLPQTLAGALNALWIRFSRISFEEAHGQRPTSPHPTEEWAIRIKAGFQESRERGDLVVDQHFEAAWRVSTLKVSIAPDLLVNTLRILIDAFTADVRHQLDDAKARFTVFEEERKKARSQNEVVELRTALALLGHRFDVSEEEYAKQLELVDTCLKSPKPGGVGKVLSEMKRTLGPHVRVVEAEEAVQHGLPHSGAAPKIIPKVSRADQEARRRVILEKLEELVGNLYARALSVRTAVQYLEAEYGSSIAAARAFDTWADRISASVMVGADEETLRAEFARQTAYVYVVRLLLVRVCEDKGLFQRKLSDGGLVRWEEQAGRYLDYAAGRSYEYLTQMAYECAQNVYVHFYGASQVFDWYRMDEKMMLRSIMALNAFDLEHIDTDIIGTVYGQYLLEGKHEQGRYYTPRPLVCAMLDALGYTGGHIVGRRLGDLACGSGSFLVEACRRLLDRYRGPDGRIPTASIETALAEVQRSFFGADLNPFACYLAETNLLIQVLDLVKRAQEEDLAFTIDRFEIYCTDSLLVNDDLSVAPGAAVTLFAPEDVVPELAKARAGDFKTGFDFLIGNPPYVRADEKAEHYVEYRRKVEEQSWFSAQHQKWDLYVPFVEQYHRLLSDDKDARACLVTIESLGTAPYAEKLRALMIQESTIHDIFFLEKLGLFADAKWQDNIVFCFSRGAPPADHTIHRMIARKQESDGSLVLEPLDSLTQLTSSPDRLFNKRPEVRLNLENTVRLDEICYVTVGMVLNSDEDLREGTIVEVSPSYNPQMFGEEVVEDRGNKGKRIRHKAFKRDELIGDSQDDIHTRPLIGSREVLKGGIGRIRWLEYGPHTRCPDRVRRPTFPELYEHNKVMFGAFTGVAVDEHESGQWAVVPHTVRIAIKWCELAKVANRALAEARQDLTKEGRYHPARSLGISEWFLCAIALSEPIQRWLHANKRSMKDDVYPEDIKAIPVKHLSRKEQQPFIDLEKERHRLWAEITALEAEGFRIGADIEIPVHTLVEHFRKEHPKMRHLTLAQAMAAGLFRVDDAFRTEDLRKAKVSGVRVVTGKRTVADVGDDIEQKAEVARLLARVLAALPATFAERQAIDRLPATERDLLALADWLDEQEAAVRRRLLRIEAIGAEVDRLAWRLYGP